jgi:hypothetical protein
LCCIKTGFRLPSHGMAARKRCRLGSAVQTEGLGFAVVFAEVPVDRGVEVEQRLEDAELQATMGEQGAENLDSGITFPILPRAAPRP